MMKLVWPALEYLDGYEAALRQVWRPDNTRPLESAREELAKIGRDRQIFVASLVDREAKGAKITETVHHGSGLARKYRISNPSEQS
jgi:hypothetical protein